VEQACLAMRQSPLESWEREGCRGAVFFGVVYREVVCHGAECGVVVCRGTVCRPVVVWCRVAVWCRDVALALEVGSLVQALAPPLALTSNLVLGSIQEGLVWCGVAMAGSFWWSGVYATLGPGGGEGAASPSRAGGCRRA